MENKQQEINLEQLARNIKIPTKELATALSHPAIATALHNDIRKGMKLGITATPSFVINGKVYVGSIPSEIINAVIKK